VEIPELPDLQGNEVLEVKVLPGLQGQQENAALVVNKV